MSYYDELIRDLNGVENAMIYAAEERDRAGQPRHRVRELNAMWWIAKGVYDLLRREVHREKSAAKKEQKT